VPGKPESRQQVTPVLEKTDRHTDVTIENETLKIDLHPEYADVMCVTACTTPDRSATGSISSARRWGCPSLDQPGSSTIKRDPVSPSVRCCACVTHSHVRVSAWRSIFSVSFSIVTSCAVVFEALALPVAGIPVARHRRCEEVDPEARNNARASHRFSLHGMS